MPGETEIRTIGAFQIHCEGVDRNGKTPLGEPIDVVVTVFDPPAQSIGCTKIGQNGTCEASPIKEYRVKCPFLNPISSFDNSAPVHISQEETNEAFFPTRETTAEAVRKLGWQNDLLGNKLKEMMTSKKIDRFEFAHKICANDQSVFDWVSGRRKPTLEQLLDIGDKFNVPFLERLGLIGLSGRLDPKEEE